MLFNQYIEKKQGNVARSHYGEEQQGKLQAVYLGRVFHRTADGPGERMYYPVGRVNTAFSISPTIANVEVKDIPGKGRASRTPKALTSWHVFRTIMKSEITLDDFKALDIRVGTVREANPAPDSRAPALRLKIDFGRLGILNSSTQLTDYYRPEDLVGRQVLAVVNLPAEQIDKYESQALVLGAYESGGAVRLLAPDMPISNGARLK